MTDTDDRGPDEGVCMEWPDQACPVAIHCAETNACMVYQLRAAGWTVEPPETP